MTELTREEGIDLMQEFIGEGNIEEAEILYWKLFIPPLEHDTNVAWVNGFRNAGRITTSPGQFSEAAVSPTK